VRMQYQNRGGWTVWPDGEKKGGGPYVCLIVSRVV